MMSCSLTHTLYFVEQLPSVVARARASLAGVDASAVSQNDRQTLRQTFSNKTGRKQVEIQNHPDKSAQ